MRIKTFNGVLRKIRGIITLFFRCTDCGKLLSKEEARVHHCVFPHVERIKLGKVIKAWPDF